MSSITTKTGDEGSSGLLFGARAPKTDVRFDALGSLDELNAVLGVARAASPDNVLKDKIQNIQALLIKLSAEVATRPEDFKRGETKFLPDNAAETLHETIKQLEEQMGEFKAFELPGLRLVGAHLHHARTVARRAERLLWGMYQEGRLARSMPCVFINRLSDLLWLWAVEDN